MKKKILLVDDYNIFRQGLKLLIEKEEDFVVSGEVTSPEGLFNQLEVSRPDVIVLNLLLPQESVVTICRKLSKDYPDIYFIILAFNTAEHTVLECVINGARGIIWKDTSPEELREVIKTVLSGERYLNIPESQMVKRIIQHAYAKHPEEHRLNELSARENEVLKLFAKGLSYKAIGENLKISPRTVESHKNNILSKLDLRSVNEMLTYAIKHRLIEL